MNSVSRRDCANRNEATSSVFRALWSLKSVKAGKCDTNTKLLGSCLTTNRCAVLHAEMHQACLCVKGSPLKMTASVPYIRQYRLPLQPGRSPYAPAIKHCMIETRHKLGDGDWTRLGSVGGGGWRGGGHTLRAEQSWLATARISLVSLTSLTSLTSPTVLHSDTPGVCLL